MRWRDIQEGVGRITKQNQTVDVGPDEITKQAKKFGNSVDKDGRPPTLSKKVKGSSTNVLFNLGLAENRFTEMELAVMEGGHSIDDLDERKLKTKAYKKSLNALKHAGRRSKRKLRRKFNEGYKLQLERDDNMYVLHITDTATGKRTEVRGKSGYESGNHDPNDKLHQLLDTVGKSANISELINGEVVTINPKHPDADRAKKATDVAYNEAFVKPQFDVEWDEAVRYPEFEKIGKEAWIKLAKKGKAVTIKSAKDINNTDAADPNSFKSLDKNKQARALAQLKSGDVEMPIVAVYSDGYKELVGGNTRLTAMMAQNGEATVWQFAVPDEVAELAENFADGKKKGKSRPGRVKRAGASCNGSVTSLRKRAKNSSGEKARMYHWCANMKSGRKKKS